MKKTLIIKNKNILRISFFSKKKLYIKNTKKIDGSIEFAYRIPVTPIRELDIKADKYCKIE